MKLILKCTVLVLSFIFLDAVNFRCDYRYTNIGWFKYHDIPATWSHAKWRCHLEGGVLASPTTPEIKSIMLESFCKPEILTGIAATYSKGDFYSVEGIPFTQIPHEWAPFEPDNKNNAENCIALHSDGKFSDVKCEELRPYICFREHSNVDVNVCGTPDSDYHFESQTNKCYKFHTKAMDFAHAHLVCSAEGAHLAIINNDEEAKIITQIFAKYPKSNIVGTIYQDIAILGYKYWDSNSEWTTIHGQSLQKAGYAKFSPGQPDNFKGREYCGTVFRTGLLNDGDCDVKYAFICEKIPNSPPVCGHGNATNHIRICDNDIQQQVKETGSEQNYDERKGPVY